MRRDTTFTTLQLMYTFVASHRFPHVDISKQMHSILVCYVHGLALASLSISFDLCISNNNYVCIATLANIQFLTIYESGRLC